ncbi:MAG: winged helix-turn-helix transcriptional regulator [Thermoplasmata archaeon]
MKEALDLENRKRIFDYVSRYPGTYLREILKELELEMGVLEYHLNYLEKKGLLSSEMDGRLRRFYVREKVAFLDRRLLGLMRQRIPRMIAIRALLESGVSFESLKDELEVSKSTLSFHLKKMRNLGILRERREGRRSIYSISQEDEVARILITYKSSFLDDLVDRFAEVWMELRV